MKLNEAIELRAKEATASGVNTSQLQRRSAPQTQGALPPGWKGVTKGTTTMTPLINKATTISKKLIPKTGASK